MNTLLLLIADGRFPAGGYAHSGGVEEAVRSGRVRGSNDLYQFLAGRLATLGRADAALSAAAWCASPALEQLAVVDREAVARCPSPALRSASRAQARGLLRAAGEIWPSDDKFAQVGPRALSAACGGSPMYPTALGAIGKEVRLTCQETALASAYACVSGPAWAAARLLGLDPFDVGRCLARLASDVGTTAADAATQAEGSVDLAYLPAYSAPMTEIGAEARQDWEVALFAS